LPTKTFLGLPKVKQEKIFRSALKEFGDKGYSLASTNTICKAAAISKGSMYQYFSSKEDLFFYVIKKALSEIINTYKTSYQLDVEKMSLKDLFLQSSMQMFEFYQNYPDHYKLYLRVSYEADAPNYKEIRRYLARYLSAITHQFITIGKKRRVLREDFSSELALFFINNFLTRIVEISFMPGIEPNFKTDISTDEERVKTLEVIYQFIIHGMGSPAVQ
jgi:AcrR family transcriptional regulator